MKNNGLLLHISSLPTEFGIGDLGPAAYQFADYLVENCYSYWQILPLYQTGYGNSPYNPLSAFALNPYLISPDLLFEDGLVERRDLEEARLPRADQVPFDSVFRAKDGLLATAVSNYLSDIEIYEYIESNALYMKPYLAFIMLCKLYGDNDWTHFRPEHRHFSSALYEDLFRQFRRGMLEAAGVQAIASNQLYRLKDYITSQNLQLIGDMPLYLAFSSSEVWANRQLFDLDEEGYRLHAAGVPADAFSESGQLWGNPVYRWDRLRETGFQLFIDRIHDALGYLDKLRLDHFIGYVNYWSVPCPPEGEGGLPGLPSDALSGNWEPALPEEFFVRLTKEFGSDRFIAEDLGILNEKVCHFRDHYGFPGMVVLQFCFEDSMPDIKSFPVPAYIYTGTHDNATLQEWYADLPENSPVRENLGRFLRENAILFAGLGLENPQDIANSIHQIMCVIAQNSACRNVIVPVQDLLGFDSRARMNIPGTALGNWQWRLQDFDALLQVRGICNLKN